MLARLEQLYPGSGYVQCRKYNPDLWLNQKYDSKLENKAPLTHWKSSPLTYERAEELSKEGWRIGWIVPPGYVVVDIDNEDHPESSEHVERILNELNIPYNYNRTSRGVHFVFKDNYMSVRTGA